MGNGNGDNELLKMRVLWQLALPCMLAEKDTSVSLALLFPGPRLTHSRGKFDLEPVDLGISEPMSSAKYASIRPNPCLIA